MISKKLLGFCNDLETDQVSTRDVNTRGVMGWGRGAIEDLSRLCLLCVMLKWEGVWGLQGLYINKNEPVDKNATVTILIESEYKAKILAQ